MDRKLFVANWKMNKTVTHAISFCTTYKESLKKLTAHADIVLCPSFPALAPIGQLLQHTNIGLGAQTCSSHEKGAYTGEVSAAMLKEVGCSYCIIGHSEQRRAAHLSAEDIAKQAVRLIAVGIEPIICIGETKKEFTEHLSKSVLEHQLNPIFHALASFKQPITIAYEPIGAIGSGILPELSYLEDIFFWLTKKLTASTVSKWRLLYGGSVNPDTIAPLKTVSHVDGFLIGDASLDFQKFEKIVS